MLYRFLFISLIAFGSVQCQSDKPEDKTAEKAQKGPEEITQFHPNGELYLTGQTDHQGRKHGQWSTWRPTGEIWTETHFLHGKKHGLYQVWHPNGNLQMKGMYKEGEKVGTWTVYSEDGSASNTKNWDENP